MTSGRKEADVNSALKVTRFETVGSPLMPAAPAARQERYLKINPTKASTGMEARGILSSN
jgi:hypothetical protein